MNQTPFDQFKDALNGRRDQHIVLGVCNALAKRFDLEPWITRTALIGLGLIFSIFTLVVYIALGFLMEETHDRTSGFFRGLCIAIKEKIQDLGGKSGNRSQHYH